MRVEQVLRERSDTACGLYPGLSREEYDALAAINCSSLKHGIDIKGKSYVANARRIKWAFESASEEEMTTERKDRLTYGAALHMAVLERERFEREVVHTNMVRNAKSSKWIEFQEEHQGKVILKTKGKFGYDRIGRILNAVTSMPEWALVLPYLESCDRECTIVTNEDGVQKKGMFDIRSRSVPALLDPKFTEIADIEGFSKSAWELGYWISMGSYREWHNRECPGDVITECVLLQIVTKPPYDLIVRPMDDADLSFGYQVQLNACRTLKDAIKNERWAGLGENMPVPCILPHWAVPKDAEMVEFAG